MIFRSFLLLLGMALLAGATTPAEAARRKTKIVLIGHQHDHPPGTHMYLEVCELLAKCLRQTRDVEAIVSDGWPKDPNVLKDVSALVFYTSPAGDILFAADHRQRAEEMMRRGAGLTVIHWGTGANKELGPMWQKVMGAWFHPDFSGLEINTAQLVQVDPRNPVNIGWKPYDLRDEYYLNLKFEPTAKPALKVNIKAGEQIVAWTYERPNSRRGRSYGSTLGHFYDNFKLEAFRRAIVNGILWTAHRKLPRAGAPVALNDADFPPSGSS
jgi:type 1 glutamine amidotransferase